MGITKWLAVLLCGGSLAFVSLQSNEASVGLNTKEELGEKLFSDPILSRGRAISCASCHIPQFAFADTAAFSIGDKGTRLTRNSPALGSNERDAAAQAVAWVGKTLQRQVDLLASIDVFWTLAIVALLMIPTAAVLRRIDLSAPARGH